MWADLNAEALRARIEDALAGALRQTDPPELYAPAAYVLEGGGKRLRPQLAVLAGAAFGARVEDAMPAAVAVEVFHNFTLVHDDIMDQADSRRGRATVHRKWDEPTAVLVGDLLMGIAYEQLARLDALAVKPALETFSVMVRRLCEGQALDMAFEKREDVTPSDYLDMIDGKTGALLACALELGVIVAGGSDQSRRVMHTCGIEIGRAFQIQDDLLDLTARSDQWGKQVGGDLLAGKRTWLLIMALDRASGADRNLLDRVLRGELTEPEIPVVRALMDRLGVLKAAGQAVGFHSGAAVDRLMQAPDSPARETLTGLVRAMQARIH